MNPRENRVHSPLKLSGEHENYQASVTSEPTINQFQQNSPMSSNFLKFPITFIHSGLKMFDKVERAHVPLCWSLDPKEDHLTNRDIDIFNPFLSIDNLPSHKNNLLECFELGQDDFHPCWSSLVNFYIP